MNNNLFIINALQKNAGYITDILLKGGDLEFFLKYF